MTSDLRPDDAVPEPVPVAGAEMPLTELSDEYTLLGELGRGGSAIVYKARDRSLMREVAIKVVRPRYASNADEAIARLEREARTVARLQHPNIVTVHAVRRLADGGLALVMQLVPGRTLKQAIVDDGPFTPERAERVLIDVAQALAFAHANGVVHRDVKPENVFLDAVSGRALLSDFGIAHSSEYDSRLTMTGAAIGTPAYMAPEQIDGAPASARSDVYSLGLLAWEMLTGERPWEGEALYNVIYKQKHEELPAIDSLRPGQVPPRLQYIVERMLQKKPAARWAGADGLLAALQAWVVPSDWKQWEESHRRRRERERERERELAKEREKARAAKLAARVAAGGDATVRFPRPAERTATGTPTPDASLPQVIATTPATGQAATTPDDDAPSWAVEPSPPRRTRWLAAAALLVAIAGGAAGLYTAGVGPFADRAPLVVAQDVPAPVSVPVVPDTQQTSSGVLALPDSAREAALRAAIARDSVVRDSVVRDSLTRVASGLDRRRADSIAAMLWRRSQREAARRATAAAAPSGVTTSSGSSTGAASPAPVTPEPARVSVRATDDPAIIAAGGRHSCAITNGTVHCWGANDRGQLGDGDEEARSAPAPVVGDLGFAQVTTGLAHSCALSRGGDAYCWGADDRGQLGDATFTSRSAPVRVAGNQTFRLLRAGQHHTCGLTTGGDILCWGSNANGQLGDGSTTTRNAPVPVSGGHRFVSLSAGWNHTCGIATDGTAFCWGANASGQLGNGSRADARAPTPVAGGHRVTSIAAGGSHTCAVNEDGDALCWGRNSFGQLGTGNTTEQTAPVPVAGGARFASVTAGGVHSCARSRGGQVFCWGRNVYGQLGDGTTTNRDTPTRVAGPSSFTSVHASGAHTCGTTGDDAMWCWGFNVEGQLGDGTRNHLARPARVSAGPR